MNPLFLPVKLYLFIRFRGWFRECQSWAIEENAIAEPFAHYRKRRIWRIHNLAKKRFFSTYGLRWEVADHVALERWMASMAFDQYQLRKVREQQEKLLERRQ
jgi:hypothetical protein